MALLTAADLRNALHMTTDPDAEQAQLAIARAQDYLATELGCRFGAGTVTEVFRVSTLATFQRLPVPLLSVSAVEVDGEALTETLQWERTRTGVVCPDGFGQDITTTATQCDVSITYAAGYTPIPSELRTWGIHLAAIAYTRGPMPGGKSLTVDGVSESYDSLMALPEAILRPLRARFGGRPVTGSVRVR